MYRQPLSTNPFSIALINYHYMLWFGLDFQRILVARF